MLRTVIFAIIILYGIHCNSEEIDCQRGDPCGPCNDDSTCTLICDDTQGCHSTAINCANSEDCHIKCGTGALTTAGGQGCHSTAMICGNTDCSIDCNDPQVCHSSAMECLNNCDIDCRGGQSCYGTDIKCADGDCFLHCEECHDCWSVTVSQTPLTNFRCTGCCGDIKGIEYKFVNDQGDKTWEEANTYCMETYQTQLAKIESNNDEQANLAFSYSTQTGQQTWVGIKDTGNNQWNYADGSTCPSGNCNNEGLAYWTDGEPNSSSGTECAFILPNAGGIESMLEENQCSLKKPAFLCDMVYDDTYEGEGDWAIVECPKDETVTFNWDTLTSDGTNIPNFKVTMGINEKDLKLNIKVEVEYIVNAYADDEPDPNWGTTYVLDFEDFDAHKSSISLPGSCSNRLASDYTQDSNTHFTITSDAINAVGTTDNMCYPPPGDATTGWSINTDEMCTKVKYIGSWTWGELTECINGAGLGSKQTFILDETDPDYDPKYISLAGTFYINMISPFWYKNYPGQLTNYYRVYQLVSQPWIIQVSKSVYVIGHTGINVMTMSIIAVYKENEDNDYTLILLTETAEYMMLQAPNLMEPLTIAGTQLNMLNNAETGTGNEACLNNKAYLCSQLWKIEAIGVICDTDFIDGGGIVFSDMYKIKFEPICRTDNGNTQYDEHTHCTNWLQDHPEFDINNVGEYKGVVLQSDLVFVDKICKAKIFTVQLKAEMKFYEEPNIETGVIEFGTVITPGSDYLYQVGESTIYVEIDLNFPTDTEAIFGSTLVNVWLCTFPPSDGTVTRTPPDQTGPTDPIDEATNGGCFSAERDGFVDGDNSDFFFHIFSSQTGIETDDFVLNDDGVLDSNIITFTFKCPHGIQRDTLYVHAQVEVELEELLQGARRRMLLNVESDNKRTANKFAHFGKNIGITNKPNNNKPKQPEIPPQEPILPIQQPPLSEPFTISLNSTWVIIIGALLSIILLCNIIYMCYMNCCKGNNGRGVTNLFNKNRRSGYRSVKNVDSEEFDISDANIINM